jgi:tRNA dimethylallyltransferase
LAEALVLAIFGPTATGKSAVAEAIAKRIPAELISADSMQVYQGLPILTNQPAYPTRLVAIWPLEEEASVGRYQPLAHAAIDESLAAGRTPVVVGGTGLYLRAAITSLRLPPPPAPAARARWEEFYDAHGPVHAHGRLQALDPEAAAAVHANDRRRVVRALELAEVGSSLAGDRLWDEDYRQPTLLAGLELPREELERRIEERARAMFAAGVEAEVRSALARPVSSTARRMLGLDEIASLPGEDALRALVVRTRRYAAYQRKWMRRSPGLVSVRADRSPAEVADQILEVARARERLPRPGGAGPHA